MTAPALNPHGNGGPAPYRAPVLALPRRGEPRTLSEREAEFIASGHIRFDDGDGEGSSGMPAAAVDAGPRAGGHANGESQMPVYSAPGGEPVASQPAYPPPPRPRPGHAHGAAAGTTGPAAAARPHDPLQPRAGMRPPAAARGGAATTAAAGAAAGQARASGQAPGSARGAAAGSAPGSAAECLALPRVAGAPAPGDVVAYRLLHVGPDWAPAVSVWRVGRVRELQARPAGVPCAGQQSARRPVCHSRGGRACFCRDRWRPKSLRSIPLFVTGAQWQREMAQTAQARVSLLQEG